MALLRPGPEEQEADPLGPFDCSYCCSIIDAHSVPTGDCVRIRRSCTFLGRSPTWTWATSAMACPLWSTSLRSSRDLGGRQLASPLIDHAPPLPRHQGGDEEGNWESVPTAMLYTDPGPFFVFGLLGLKHWVFGLWVLGPRMRVGYSMSVRGGFGSLWRWGWGRELLTPDA